MSKKTYEALPGVEWVNGQLVPENREIKLSAAEALFDLAQGRIQLKSEEEAWPDGEAISPPAPPSAPPSPKRR